MRKLVAAGVACVLLVSACGSSTTELDAVVVSIDDVIRPAYGKAVSDLSVLATAVDSLCLSPGAGTLGEARASWLKANRSWKFLGPMSFGPIADNRTNTWVDYKVTDTEKIDELLESGVAITDEYVFDVAASTQRGLGAVEYIVYGTVEDLEDLDTCGYLGSLLTVALAQAELVEGQWAPGQPFPSMMVDDPHMGVGEIVQGLAFSAAKLTKNTLTLATATTLTIDEVPEGPAGTGVRDVITELAAMQELYMVSGEGTSISQLVTTQSRELDQNLRQLFPQCLEALDLLEASRIGGMADQDIGLDAFQCLDELRITIETDLVSQLDVTLGFSDTDGDSG